MKVIISGGGTGGHIFPAISIANALREINPSTEILFVGAKGKMEMEKVPAEGYNIKGLPVAGFHRQLNLKNVVRNIAFPFKLIASMYQARKIVKDFKPDVAVGVGGYASGPVLRCASNAGIPCLLQEQNSFPGVTNRILSQKAQRICVAYPNMERFFEASKIILTGNPVRQQLLQTTDKTEGYKHFGVDGTKPVILVIGGSLGARSINNGIKETLDDLGNECQLIWQTGKIYYDDIKAELDANPRENVKAMAFIQRMDLAFAIADIVISRAGASSISELSLLGKASILVPSPNVSEDHQTKNARALSDKGAAILVRNAECDTLLKEAVNALQTPAKLEELKTNIVEFARPNASMDIANEVITLAGQKRLTE